jgi:hypothetical protein
MEEEHPAYLLHRDGDEMTKTEGRNPKLTNVEAKFENRDS